MFYEKNKIISVPQPAEINMILKNKKAVGIPTAQSDDNFIDILAEEYLESQQRAERDSQNGYNRNPNHTDQSSGRNISYME
jgi:hypothetical protein